MQQIIKTIFKKFSNETKFELAVETASLKPTPPTGRPAATASRQPPPGKSANPGVPYSTLSD
jgi:hypothetical protein